MLAASAALHAIVLVALLVTLPRQRPLEEPLPPPAVAVIFQGGAPEAPSQPKPTPNQSDNAKPAPTPTPDRPPVPDAVPATRSPPPVASPAPTPEVAAPSPEEASQAEASPPIQTQPPPPQAQVAPEQPPPSTPKPAPQSEALLQLQAPPTPEPQPPSTPPPLSTTPPPNVPPRVELYLARPPAEPPPLEMPEPPPPLPPRPPPPRPHPQPRNEFTPTFREWALGRPPPPETGGFGPKVQGPSREAPQIRGAERLGADWANELSAWVEAHKYYPQQAILNGEDGSPEVDVTVRRDGTVLAVDLDTRSGSQWLDLALQALFRGAHLPPFPDGTGTQQLTFHFTMHYILVRR